MNILSFSNCYGKATEKEILDCENLCKVVLPHKLKEIVLLCDGANFKKNIFIYSSKSSDFYENSSIGMFHIFSTDEELRGESFAKYYNNPPEFFPEGIISFASVGNGDLICFDYRADPQTDNPPIVMWEHEAAGSEEAVSFIAPDFEAFMNMLMSDEEAEKEYERLTAGHE